jgi:hypothetical protein
VSLAVRTHELWVVLAEKELRATGIWKFRSIQELFGAVIEFSRVSGGVSRRRGACRLS